MDFLRRVEAVALYVYEQGLTAGYCAGKEDGPDSPPPGDLSFLNSSARVFVLKEAAALVAATRKGKAPKSKGIPICLN